MSSSAKKKNVHHNNLPYARDIVFLPNEYNIYIMCKQNVVIGIGKHTHLHICEKYAEK